MSIEFDCEMKIDGFDNIGDSKRKSYENQVKCSAVTPSIYSTNHGSGVMGSMKGRVSIDDVPVHGVCQNPGNLRQAMISDKTRFKSIIISRFAKIQGSKEEKVIQTITLSEATITDLHIHDHTCEFSANLSYEKIEIKDFKIKTEDGTLDGSPMVTSYDRLTGEVNS